MIESRKTHLFLFVGLGVLLLNVLPTVFVTAYDILYHDHYEALRLEDCYKLADDAQTSCINNDPRPISMAMTAFSIVTFAFGMLTYQLGRRLPRRMSLLIFGGAMLLVASFLGVKSEGLDTLLRYVLPVWLLSPLVAFWLFGLHFRARRQAKTLSV